MERTEQAIETRIVGALVLSTTLAKFDELKQVAANIGCKILFQRTAPFSKLWIVERERDGMR